MNYRGVGSGLAQDHAKVCAQLLGVGFPAQEDELKRAYREKAREHHPDKGGDSHMFRRVKEAYDFLKNNSYLCIAPHASGCAGRTIQGDFLSELGKGLGPRVNGTTCTMCEGRGYSQDRWYEKITYYTCFKCNGTGEVEMFNPVLPKWRLGRTKQGSKPREKKRHGRS